MVEEKNDSVGLREAVEKAVAVPQPSDMERLMVTGARLLKSKMDEHLAAVSAYERKRVELLDGYRVGIERMRIECEDQLRSLEHSHVLHLDALEKLIAKLKALREA